MGGICSKDRQVRNEFGIFVEEHQEKMSSESYETQVLFHQTIRRHFLSHRNLRDQCRESAVNETKN